MTNPFSLTGKTALVTGGNGGIGFGIARGLAQAGARIAIIARNTEKSHAAAKALAEETGVAPVVLTADVSIPEQVNAVVTEAKKGLGRIDILVNNAGTTIRKAPQDLAPEEWHKVMDVNLTSAFLVSKAVYPHMKQSGGGKIINIGSMTSYFGASYASPYAASKGGIVQLTKSVALAWAADNIQVNALLPGWFETELTDGARVQVPGLYEKVLARIPAGRWAKPEDIAGMAGEPRQQLCHWRGHPSRRRLFIEFVLNLTNGDLIDSRLLRRRRSDNVRNQAGGSNLFHQAYTLANVSGKARACQSFTDAGSGHESLVLRQEQRKARSLHAATIASDMVLKEGSPKWTAAHSIRGLFPKPAPAASPAAAVSPPRRKGRRILTAVAVLLLLSPTAWFYLQTVRFEDRWRESQARLSEQTRKAAEASDALEALRKDDQIGALTEQLLRRDEAARQAQRNEERLQIERASLEKELQELKRVQDALGQKTEVEAQLRRELAHLEAKWKDVERALEARNKQIAAVATDERDVETQLRKELANLEAKHKNLQTEHDALRTVLNSKRDYESLRIAVVNKEAILRKLGQKKAPPYYLIDELALLAPASMEADAEMLARYLVALADTDKDKARAIFRWIADRIAYDAESFFKKDFGDNSPEGVLKNRKGVCAGYANLFECLGKAAGLEVVVVTGFANIETSKDLPTDDGRHAWNAVKIDGEWRLLDATWGAGYLDKDRKFVKRLREMWFLPPPAHLIVTHDPEDPKWQLLDPPAPKDEMRQIFAARVAPEALADGILTLPDLRGKLRDKTFAGLPKIWRLEGVIVRYLELPLSAKLKEGVKYTFRIESKERREFALSNNKKFAPFFKKGDIYEHKGTFKSGDLAVLVKADDGKMWNILEYQVD
jgi:2-deoxy-D-gluconate 3-dehydrogenase